MLGLFGGDFSLVVLVIYVIITKFNVHHLATEPLILQHGFLTI